MIISRVKLRNWRNFREGEASFRDVSYVLGPNASGKSNFLDVFRFIRDIAKPSGGGLQKAVNDRGGLAKLRCLHARTKPEVTIEIEVSENADSLNPVWEYHLTFNTEGKGAHRLLVTRESVIHTDENGLKRTVLSRPDKDDEADTDRLTQTALEQIQANGQFRDLADILARTTYLHVVPQLLKFADQIGGRRLEDDPFGQGFMERIARTPDRVRKGRLSRIEKALKQIIPHMENLEFIKDEISGRPHLEVKYKHHRPRGARQREDQFSDGTLRLIALFWLLQDGDALLLLEEPELSLNEEIIEQLPRIFETVQRSAKRRRQIIVTTHSQSLLNNAGIDARSLIVLTPSLEGTTIGEATDLEKEAMRAGLTPAETVLPRARRPSGSETKSIAQMELAI